MELLANSELLQERNITTVYFGGGTPSLIEPKYIAKILDLIRLFNNSIEEITIFNRLGQIDFKVEDFTVEQLENYNVKQHKQLCKKFEDSDWHFRSYKQLILK